MRTRIVWNSHELELVAEAAAKLLVQGATRSKMVAVSEGQKTALVDKSRWRTIRGVGALKSIEFPLEQAVSRLKRSKSSEEAAAYVPPTEKPIADKALLRAKLLASAQQFVDTLLELLDANASPPRSETESTLIDPVQVLLRTSNSLPDNDSDLETVGHYLEDEDTDLDEDNEPNLEDEDDDSDLEDEDGKPSPDETPAGYSKPVAHLGAGFNDEWLTVAFAGVEDDIRKLIESSFPSGLNFVWFETTASGVQLFSKTLDNKAFPIDYCLLKTGKQSTAFHLLATRRMHQRCLVVTGIADIRNRLEFLIRKERRVRNEEET